MNLRFFRSDDRRALAAMLAALQRPVQLLLFTSAANDQYSGAVRDMLAEFAGLHTLLELTILDGWDHQHLASAFGIQQTPATIVLDEQWSPYGVRFYGLPGGYCFPALLEAVLILGGAITAGISPTTYAWLDQLSSPVWVQVFVSAAEQSSAEVTALVYKLACASSNIIAEAIDIHGFPQLAQHYYVTCTPTTVVNDHVLASGWLTETELFRYLRRSKL